MGASREGVSRLSRCLAAADPGDVGLVAPAANSWIPVLAGMPHATAHGDAARPFPIPSRRGWPGGTAGDPHVLFLIPPVPIP